MEKKLNVIRGKNQSISLAASIIASFKEVVLPFIKVLAGKMQCEIESKILQYKKTSSALDIEIESEKLEI